MSDVVKSTRTTLGPTKVWCIYCFVHTDRIYRHSCPAVGRQLTVDEKQKCRTDSYALYQRSNDFAFYNPRSSRWPSQEWFSRDQVFALLLAYGHNQVSGERQTPDSHLSQPQLTIPAAVRPVPVAVAVSSPWSSPVASSRASTHRPGISYAAAVSPPASRGLIVPSSFPALTGCGMDASVDSASMDSSSFAMPGDLDGRLRGLYQGKEHEVDGEIETDAPEVLIPASPLLRSPTSAFVSPPLAIPSSSAFAAPILPLEAPLREDTCPVASGLDLCDKAAETRKKGTAPHKRAAPDESTSDYGNGTSPLRAEPRPKRTKVRSSVVEERGTLHDTDHDVDYLPCTVQRSPRTVPAGETVLSKRVASRQYTNRDKVVSKRMVKIIPAYPLAIAGASASAAAPPIRRNYQNDSVKKACSEAGLYDVHPYHDHERFPIFEDYTSYHTEIKNKSVSQVKDDLSKIKIALWWINQNAGKAVPTLDLSLLTCKAIEDLSIYLESLLLAHATIRLYMQSLTHFINFIICRQILPPAKCVALLKTSRDATAGASSRDRADVQERKASDLERTCITNPFQLTEVLRKGKPTTLLYIEALLAEQAVNSIKLNFVNSFFIAYVCLKHGQRPGVIVNMKVTELQASQPVTVDGVVWRVVRVAEHKTSEKYTAQFGLEPYVYDMLVKYLQIRVKVLAANGKTGKVRYLLVCSNGSRLNGPSEMLASFHKKNGMNKHYTSRQAQQTYETWSQHLSTREKEEVSEYLGHKRYNTASRFHAVVEDSRRHDDRMPASQPPAAGPLLPPTF